MLTLIRISLPIFELGPQRVKSWKSRSHGVMFRGIKFTSDRNSPFVDILKNNFFAVFLTVS